MQTRFSCAAASLLVMLQAPQGRAEWVASPAAVQTVFQSGIPHTDRTGRPINRYDHDRLFFPIGLYRALHGEVRGVRYDLADYVKAGFNTVHLWERQKLATSPTPRPLRRSS